MLPDDDKRYAIETCRSSESVLKKLFKINDIISAFVGSVIFGESTRCTVQQQRYKPTCLLEPTLIDIHTNTQSVVIPRPEFVRFNGASRLKVQFKICRALPLCL